MHRNHGELKKLGEFCMVANCEAHADMSIEKPVEYKKVIENNQKEQERKKAEREERQRQGRERGRQR